MRCVTAEQMRELDRAAMEEDGIPGDVLMERAGRGLADCIHRELAACSRRTPRVLFCAGGGNNGGDAFAAARMLQDEGVATEVWLAVEEGRIKGDAQTHFKALKKSGVPVRLLKEADWKEGWCAQPDLLVDGLLGTGASGAPHGAVAEAIRFINRYRTSCTVLAIDIPSGLDADSGAPSGDTVQADTTVTMACPKNGLLKTEALEWVGSLEVVDIGFRPERLAELPSDDGPELISQKDLAPVLAPRSRAGHKGTYGHVLLIGGAPGFTGAISMAARAAVRAGAGLVTVLTPGSVTALVAAAAPEVMVEAGLETDTGSLSFSNWKSWRERIDDFSSIVAGPGMTCHEDTLTWVRQLVREARVPMIFDADAINACSGQPHILDRAHSPVVITPHPGELARLFGQDIEEVQADRVGMAEAAAKFTGATVVLKGGGTVVVGKDRPVSVNLTGNPGMATGGSGDVLAGMIGASLGQGLSTWDAARLSVYLHGRAGDHAARSGAQVSVSAGDLIDRLPAAYRELLGR